MRAGIAYRQHSAYYLPMRRSDVIKRAREQRHWSQRKLAQRAGVDVSTVSKLEKGGRVPLISTVEKLEDALGITPEMVKRLLSGEEDQLGELPKLIEEEVISEESIREAITRALGKQGMLSDSAVKQVAKEIRKAEMKRISERARR